MPGTGVEEFVIRIVVLLLALAIPASAAGVPAGVPLWEGSRTGMELARVLALFPKAHQVEPTQKDPTQIEQRGKQRARIPRLEIAGAPYQAQFFFKDGLYRVVLNRIDADGVPFSQGLKLTREVEGALTEKYGDPASKQTSGDGYLATWRNGPTAIDLVVITKSYQVKAFKIVYKPVEEAGKAPEE
jgi:hypothetical protein